MIKRIAIQIKVVKTRQKIQIIKMVTIKIFIKFYNYRY